MRFFRTTATIRLSAGIVLALTAEQVELRQHLLDVGSDGEITTREPIELKAGERVGFEQEPRALLPMLEPLEFDDDGDSELFGVGRHAANLGDESVGANAEDQEETDEAACADGIDQLKMVAAAHLGIDPEIVSDKPAKKSAK